MFTAVVQTEAKTPPRSTESRDVKDREVIQPAKFSLHIAHSCHFL